MLQKLPIIFITPFALEITITIKGTVYASFSFISLNLSIILILRMQWRQRVKIKCNHLQGVQKTHFQNAAGATVHSIWVMFLFY